MVPPVPMPETSTSIRPPVSSQISGPVVRKWISGLAGVLNYSNSTKRPGSEATIPSARAMEPAMPSKPSVRIRLAPSALSTLRRSTDMVSGMVSVMGYPRAAATKARAIPVFPLVGSMSALPGFRMPRFSASQTIEAPIRHFTEYAGLRPSILASTTALPPSVTRLRRTSGVEPMLKELSSKTLNSDLPGQNVLILFLRPAALQIGEGGSVHDLRHGVVHLLPQTGERRLRFAAGTRSALVRPLHETSHLAHRDGIGGPRQQVAALGAAPRFHKATLLQPGENQLQKFLRNSLAAGDVGNTHRLAGAVRRPIENRLPGAFSFHGNVHVACEGPIPFVPVEIVGRGGTKAQMVCCTPSSSAGQQHHLLVAFLALSLTAMAHLGQILPVALLQHLAIGRWLQTGSRGSL